jgi:hypothetical protein
METVFCNIMIFFLVTDVVANSSSYGQSSWPLPSSVIVNCEETISEVG